MTRDRIQALLGDKTSRRNKMALLADSVAIGDMVEWKWEAVPYRSRLLISVNGGPFIRCRSFDEDVLTTFDDPGAKKK